MNSALQRAYRAAGRASSFFVTLLFNSYHTKGFYLFPRQASEGDVKLAQLDRAEAPGCFNISRT